MKFHRMYALSIRHIYLIKSSFPRILDLIYWPTIQILLWGFISQFFTMYSDYYNNTIGVILSCAILYDFLFRSSISFNMLFLEEIWSRNFTNLFVAPIKLNEIITALTSTALLRTLIGIIPIKVLRRAVDVSAVMTSLIFNGETNRLTKFLLHISSRNNMLKLMLDRNKKS